MGAVAGGIGLPVSDRRHFANVVITGHKIGKLIFTVGVRGSGRFTVIERAAAVGVQIDRHIRHGRFAGVPYPVAVKVVELRAGDLAGQFTIAKINVINTLAGADKHPMGAGQRPAAVATECHHRVFAVPRCIHVETVRAHRYCVGAIQAVHTVGPVLEHLHERQEAAGRVPAEHRHRLINVPCRIHVETVGAHRHGPRASQPVHAAGPVLQYLLERQDAAGRVPAEHRHRVIKLPRHIRVATVGAHRYGPRAIQPVHAVDPILEHLNER